MDDQGEADLSDRKRAVANHLSAVMISLGIKTYPAMAENCKTSPSVIGNWMNALNLPRVPEMIKLSECTVLTLDWIYRGVNGSADPEIAQHLAGIIDSIDR